MARRIVKKKSGKDEESTTLSVSAMAREAALSAGAENEEEELQIGDDDGEDEEEAHLDEESETEAEEDFSDSSVEALIEKSRREAAFDIFKDLGEKLMKQGVPVLYMIRKHGQHLATVTHQEIGSWDELRAAHGPGHYAIQARNGINNKILRHQTNVLAEYHVKTPKSPIEGAAMLASKKSSETTDILAIMLQMNEQQNRRAEEQRRADQERADKQLQLMMTMMQESSKTLASVMGAAMKPASSSSAESEINKLMLNFMAQSVEKQQTMMERFMDKVEEKLGKGAMGSRSKFDDPLALIELLNTAEERGYTKMQSLQEMAKQMAQEMSERGGGESESKSMMDRLIETVAPLAAQAIAKGPGPLGIPGSVAPTPEQIAAHQARARAKAAMNARQTKPAPVVVTKQPQPQPQPRPQRTLKAVEPKPLTTPETLITLEGELDMQASKRDEIVGLMKEHFPQWLMNRKPAKMAAQESVALFMRSQLSVDEALSHFPTKESLLSEAHRQGLPSLADSWLNEYHAELVSLASSTRSAAGS